MIDAFDVAVIEFFGRLTNRSVAFDQTVNIVRDSNLLKGGILTAALWWCWARRGWAEPGEAARAAMIVVAVLVSVVAGRALQLLLPFRERPLHDAAVAFVPPHGVTSGFLDGWSSFPSDHAVLFFGLSAAIWSYDRRAGIFAFLWTLVVVCLPRLYSGVHYPTDLIGGGVVGIIIMVAALKMPLPARLRGFVGRAVRHNPGWAYAFLFLITFQLAELFRGLRDVVGWSVKLMSIAATDAQVLLLTQ